MLTKDQIWAANDRPRKFVPVKEWKPEGETFDPAVHGVWVGTMSSREKDAWECEMLTGSKDDRRKNADNARAKLAARTVQNEDGSRMFADADAEWLGDKSSAAMSAVFDVALQLNRVKPDDLDELAKSN